MDKLYVLFWGIDNNSFNSKLSQRLCVRNYFLAFLLCGIFFLFPFQIYIIGNGIGIGIEGAVYRAQITNYGNTFIPITSDIMFIVRGLYSGKTALSVIVWGLGTILLTTTTIFALIFVGTKRTDYGQQITLGLVGTCIFYLVSCIAQYGFFFNGPAGISIPIGILLILAWVTLINSFPRIFPE